MMLPDVNVLLHAFREDSPRHSKCRAWLHWLLNSGQRYAMSPHVLSGVIRVATHRNVFDPPSELNETIEYCTLLLQSDRCQVVVPGERHWPIFARLLVDADAHGNLVADAWLAALAIEWGCEWITFDRDFARFSGLRWKVPAIP